MAKENNVDGSFFMLSLLGIGFQLVSWVIVFLTWLYPLAMQHWMAPLGMDPSTMNHWILTIGGMLVAPSMGALAALGLSFIALGLVGLRLTQSSRRDTIRAGGLVLILSAAIAYPTAWGFFVGSILMVLGGMGVLGEIVSRERAPEQIDVS